MKNRNYSIDIFRYLCAILVVAIHVDPLIEINETASYIITEIIARIAVPFFFAVSGYYFIPKLEKEIANSKSYILSLLRIYATWSIMYFLVDFFKWGHESIIGFIANSLEAFFITGSYYHLWFFPALIISVVTVTLIFRIHAEKMLIPVSLLLYAIGCLGTSYYRLGSQIPLFQTLIETEQFVIIRRIFLMGLPFFVCGYITYKIQEKVKRINSFLIVSIAGWILEIVFVIKYEMQSSIVLTMCLYLLVLSTILFLQKHPGTHLKNQSKACYVLANFTYYAHPLFLLAMPTIGTTTFFITVIATGIVGFIIYKANNRYLNKLIK